VKRFALLLAGGAFWLFLAALPALADGGPHAMAQNSGSSTLTADGCASCHRAHTAKGLYLLNDASASVSINAYCTTCHGASGTGATTDVMTGVQYRTGTTDVRGSLTVGALRGGGFSEARIDSSNAVRASYTSTRGTSFVAKVGVTAPTAVTSAHIALPTVAGLEPQDKIWGNGTTGAGPVVELECISCHNPHGNGQYRILRPVPVIETGTWTPYYAFALTSVSDDTNNLAAVVSPGTDARNYSIIQYNPATTGRYLLASDVIAAENAGTFGATAGDYFHRKVPWTSTASSGTAATWDGPNGDPGGFNTQINAWCIQCHSRYLSTGWSVNTGDPIFTYRHSQSNNKSCLTCHVAHGSNAVMNGINTGNFPYPDGTKTNSSRLLKVDNRGTCQACHEPTGSVIATTATPGAPNPYTGTWPSPVLP